MTLRHRQPSEAFELGVKGTEVFQENQSGLVVTAGSGRKDSSVRPHSLPGPARFKAPQSHLAMSLQMHIVATDREWVWPLPGEDGNQE